MSEHKCEFPCDCPNPNDCSHECEGLCGAPVLLCVWGIGRNEACWMCRKHAYYELICLERSAHCLRQEIQKALDSVIDVDFKDEPHVFPVGVIFDDEDAEPDKEAKRLEKEHHAEREANENAPY